MNLKCTSHSKKITQPIRNSGHSNNSPSTKTVQLAPTPGHRQRRKLHHCTAGLQNKVSRKSVSQKQKQHILIGITAQQNTVLSTWSQTQKGKRGEKPAINMSDYNKEEKTPETAKIKIENLQIVSTEYSDQKRKKTDGTNDSTAYNTLDIYGNNKYHVQKSPNNITMPTIEEQNEEPVINKSASILADEEFIPIGSRSNVDWKFVLTAATTDNKIHAKVPGCLTNAVIQVEKILKIKVQDITSLLGPRELAIKARDLLICEADISEAKTGNKQHAFQIPNPVYDIDPSTQQNPGVPVTPEEQKLADKGYFEYTFRVELYLKKGTNELALFQQFTSRVTVFDKGWYGNNNKNLPKI